jgi:TPP-dependent pyruvate/acetoin dehydrogenase alpha subunit
MPRYHNINGVRVQFTAEEETARDAEEAAWEAGALGRAQADLRSRRNNLLAETDFYALSDVTMSDDMKTYRQELRDFPAGKDTVDKCKNATWPTKP